MAQISRSHFGPFLIDVRERVLQRDGQQVALTPKAFDVLAALVEHPGKLVTKDELIERVWPDTVVEESNLAYNVFAVRKALGDQADHACYIETVPKRGYRFIATVTPANGDSAARAVAPEPHETATGVRSEPPPAFPPAPQLGARSVWPWALLATAILATGAVLMTGQWSANPDDLEHLTAVPLTSLPGVVRSPSLSPDGRYVAFVWSGANQENQDIYVQQIGGGAEPIRRTAHPGNDYSPSWSPDGSSIVFLRQAGKPAGIELWRIPAFGGVEKKLRTLNPRLPSFRPMAVSWSPDSRYVVVTDSLGPDRPDALFLVDVDTGEKRQITHPSGLSGDADGIISPDGKTLVFRRDSTPASGRFYRLALSERGVPAGEPVRLTSTLYAGKPVWMPDGRTVMFPARGGLWRLDARYGDSPKRLPYVGLDGQWPTVAPNPGGGFRLVYHHSFADTNVWRVDVPGPGVPAASPPAAAIATTRTDALPNLAPLESRLVFLSDRTGHTEFWVSDLNGSHAVQLTRLGILPGFARWSPDGRLIAFHGDPQGRPDILIMPAGGGEPAILTKDLPGGGYPSFSRDGQFVYFSSAMVTGELRIWKRPASGGSALPVTPNIGAISIESYEGDLYYVDVVQGPGTLWCLPRTGGSPVKVLSGIVSGNFDVVEAGIYYMDTTAPDAGAYFTNRPRETRLRFFDFATRQSTTVVEDLGRVTFSLSATRDGRTIFFSRVDSSVNELMMVDGFK